MLTGGVPAGRLVAGLLVGFFGQTFSAAQTESAEADSAPSLRTADNAASTVHPVITEILFSVPTDDGTGRGDANNDGTREVAGDEFVEIANPHDVPIQLLGYVLRDSAPPGPTRFEFVFPELVLEPGQCAVVFNGRNARWDGPVGDTNRAPQAPHPLFNGAHVFTARCSGRVTFANAGDWVMLVGPSGERVQAVSWGSPKLSVPSDVTTVENAGRVGGMSIQRDSVTGELTKHADLDGRLYSPGEAFVAKPEPEPEPASDPDEQALDPDKATRRGE